MTSSAATFPWPSPTQQNLLQKLTSMQQCPTSRGYATSLHVFACLWAQGWKVATLEMLRAVSGVAGCWLYRGMTSLEPPTELCTGALTSDPPTPAPTLPTAPQTHRQPIFKPQQPPAMPCSPPVHCVQPHSKVDARQISLCVGIWVTAKNETVPRRFFQG